jgi:hypothetical protein
VPWTTGDGGPNRDSNPVTLQSFASRSRNALLGYRFIISSKPTSRD